MLQTIFRQYPPPIGKKPLGQPPSADTEVGATSENARDGVRKIPKSEDFILNTKKLFLSYRNPAAVLARETSSRQHFFQARDTLQTTDEPSCSLWNKKPSFRVPVFQELIVE